ncbi:hypothetical protein [Actinoalloteichus caeruleus]|uniref:hypothetical protein n=1 Tax=Actinoalloteichus cyanogriseus TaxID=2893586 RepID=UPI003AAA6CB6
MTALRLVVLARRPGRCLLAFTVSLLGALLFWRVAVHVEPFGANPRRTLPYPELAGVVTGAVFAGLLAPGFWEWERLGGARSRAVAGVVAALGCLAPLPAFLLGVAQVPERYHALTLWSNVLLFTALAFLLAALVGPAVGAAVTVGSFLLVVLLTNAAPAAVGWLPVTAPEDPTSHPVAALALLGVAIAAHAATFGSTGFARRLSRGAG